MQKPLKCFFSQFFLCAKSRMAVNTIKKVKLVSLSFLFLSPMRCHCAIVVVLLVYRLVTVQLNVGRKLQVPQKKKKRNFFF